MFVWLLSAFPWPRGYYLMVPHMPQDTICPQLSYQDLPRSRLAPKNDQRYIRVQVLAQEAMAHILPSCPYSSSFLMGHSRLLKIP